MKKQERLRTCVACRRKMDQARLNRVVIQDGRLLADARGAEHGRGAYICSSMKCLRHGLIRGAFGRSLRGKFAEADPLELAVAFQDGLRGRLVSWSRGLKSSGSESLEVQVKEALSLRLSEWESEVAEAQTKGGSMMGLS